MISREMAETRAEVCEFHADQCRDRVAEFYARGLVASGEYPPFVRSLDRQQGEYLARARKYRALARASWFRRVWVRG